MSSSLTTAPDRDERLARLLAELTETCRQVHCAATPADVARFQVEAQAAAHLDHSAIVPVYAAGEHDGQAFFCMRLVEGDTLTTHLARGPLRPREAARLLAAIARGVHYAHEHGIL